MNLVFLCLFKATAKIPLWLSLLTVSFFSNLLTVEAKESNLELAPTDTDTMAQVTSVSQLSDVQPTDWAFCMFCLCIICEFYSLSFSKTSASKRNLAI